VRSCQAFVFFSDEAPVAYGIGMTSNVPSGPLNGRGFFVVFLIGILLVVVLFVDFEVGSFVVAFLVSLFGFFVAFIPILRCLSFNGFDVNPLSPPRQQSSSLPLQDVPPNVLGRWMAWHTGDLRANIGVGHLLVISCHELPMAYVLLGIIDW
jgi:hypothetical protein